MALRSIAKIRKNISRGLAAALLAFGASVGLVAGVSGSANAQANPAAQNTKTMVGAVVNAKAKADPIIACGSHPSDKDGSSWGKYFRVNGVNMRKRATTNSPICGQGQKSHRTDYHCYKVGADGYTWTYVRDVATHYAGWVRDDLLTNYGSLVHC